MYRWRFSQGNQSSNCFDELHSSSWGLGKTGQKVWLDVLEEVSDYYRADHKLLVSGVFISRFSADFGKFIFRYLEFREKSLSLAEKSLNLEEKNPWV